MVVHLDDVPEGKNAQILGFSRIRERGERGAARATRDERTARDDASARGATTARERGKKTAAAPAHVSALSVKPWYDVMFPLSAMRVASHPPTPRPGACAAAMTHSSKRKPTSRKRSRRSTR